MFIITLMITAARSHSALLGISKKNEKFCSACAFSCVLRVLATFCLCSVRQFTTRLFVYAYVMRVLGTLCSARPRYLVLCASIHYIYAYVFGYVLQTRPNGVSLPLLLHTKIDSKKTMTQKSARKATTPGTRLCT